MRCIIQILSKGSIKTLDVFEEIKDETLIVYTGIRREDTEETIKRAIQYFSETDFKNIYFISNYTINGRLKGQRFTYNDNMVYDLAEEFFYKLYKEIKEVLNKKIIKRGVFGGLMEIKGNIKGVTIIDII